MLRAGCCSLLLVVSLLLSLLSTVYTIYTWLLYRPGAPCGRSRVKRQLSTMPHIRPKDACTLQTESLCSGRRSAAPLRFPCFTNVCVHGRTRVQAFLVNTACTNTASHTVVGQFPTLHFKLVTMSTILARAHQTCLFPHLISTIIACAHVLLLPVALVCDF